METSTIAQSTSRHARTRSSRTYSVILQRCVVSTIRVKILWIGLISIGITAASSLLPAFFLIKPYGKSEAVVSVSEWPSHLAPLACSGVASIYVTTYSRFGFSHTDYSSEYSYFDAVSGDYCSLRLFRVGWPFKALYGYEWGHRRKTVKQFADSFCLAGFEHNWEHRFIPLCPTIGIVYNALCFVFSLSLITIIVTCCMMIYRHLHALCIHCSYPIGHAGICSECGQPTGVGLGASR